MQGAEIDGKEDVENTIDNEPKTELDMAQGFVKMESPLPG